MDSELKDRIENKLKTIRFINASAEYAAREIMGIIAPELADAEKWRCLGYETAYIKPENYDEIKADAERWRRVKEIAEWEEAICERHCPVWDVCCDSDNLCTKAFILIDALEGEGEKG